MRGDGKALATSDFFLDGKEYQTGTMTTIGQRIDERHFKETAKGEKGTSVIDYVVSADGKTLTVTRKGTGTNTAAHSTKSTYTKSSRFELYVTSRDSMTPTSLRQSPAVRQLLR
jgi:hypothetical protein